MADTEAELHTHMEGAARADRAAEDARRKQEEGGNGDRDGDGDGNDEIGGSGKSEDENDVDDDEWPGSAWAESELYRCFIENGPLRVLFLITNDGIGRDGSQCRSALAAAPATLNRLVKTLLALTAAALPADVTWEQKNHQRTARGMFTPDELLKWRSQQVAAGLQPPVGCIESAEVVSMALSILNAMCGGQAKAAAMVRREPHKAALTKIFERLCARGAADETTQQLATHMQGPGYVPEPMHDGAPLMSSGTMPKADAPLPAVEPLVAFGDDDYVSPSLEFMMSSPTQDIRGHPPHPRCCLWCKQTRRDATTGDNSDAGDGDTGDGGDGGGGVGGGSAGGAVKFKKCSRCRRAYYCTSACTQLADWKRHKIVECAKKKKK
jgi:hypothetical protein